MVTTSIDVRALGADVESPEGLHLHQTDTVADQADRIGSLGLCKLIHHKATSFQSSPH